MPTQSRLSFALGLSALLHLALMAGRMPAPASAVPERLDVMLAPPPASMAEVEPAPPEPTILEKNTLVPVTAPQQLPPQLAQQVPPPINAQKPARLKAAAEQQALRKLSDYILYPQAAIEANHEGTVHLLIKVDALGNIVHASVAASSNYPELDHAAVQAALRAGRLNTGNRPEILLPVTFRLQ